MQNYWLAHLEQVSYDCYIGPVNFLDKAMENVKSDIYQDYAPFHQQNMISVYDLIRKLIFDTKMYSLKIMSYFELWDTGTNMSK